MLGFSPFNDLYELRQEGDYVDLVHVEAEQVRPKVAEVEVFVEKIAILASAEPGDGAG